MGLLNYAKLVWLLEDFLRNMTLIIKTFTLVAKMTSIRILISLIVARRWPPYQMDFKNALLYGELSEVIYMQPPSRVFAPT